MWLSGKAGLELLFHDLQERRDFSEAGPEMTVMAQTRFAPPMIVLALLRVANRGS